MKTYNITSRVSSSAKAAINNCITQHEKYAKAYFWSSASNAGQRRRNEQRVNAAHPEFTLVQGENTIEVKPYYSESCKNCYYRLDVFVNGQKKTVAAIKKIIK